MEICVDFLIFQMEIDPLCNQRKTDIAETSDIGHWVATALLTFFLRYIGVKLFESIPRQAFDAALDIGLIFNPFWELTWKTYMVMQFYPDLINVWNSPIEILNGVNLTKNV